MSVPMRAPVRTGARVGVFTKPRGSDYRWTERGAIPDEVAELAPWIAGFGTPISIVLPGPTNWVIRCSASRGGGGGDDRVIMSAEVYRLDGDEPLAATDALALAADGAEPHEDRGQWRFAIRSAPGPKDHILSTSERVAARLALPLSVALDAAQELVSIPPWRFRGICIAHVRQVAWSEELRGMLAVNTSLPRLEDREQQLLDAGAALLDERRWAILDRLPAEQAHLLLRGVTSSLQEHGFTAELVEWLALDDPGPTALATVVERLRIPPETAIASLGSLLQRELGQDAVAALRATVDRQPAEWSGATLDILCERGFLRWLGVGHLKAWADRAGDSACAEAFLIESVAGNDYGRGLIRWLLRGSAPDGREWPSAHEGMALEHMARLGVAPHLNAFAAWLSTVDAADRPVLERLDATFDGAVRVLVQVALSGEAGDWERLSEEQTAAALTARHRLFGEDAVLEAILRLRGARGIEVTTAVLALCADTTAGVSSFRIIASAVLATLRNDVVPDAVPEDLLRRLITRGLLSASAMPVRKHEDLVRATQLFGGMEPLASLLTRAPHWTGRPAVPERWRSVARVALPAMVLQRAAASVDREDRESFLEFVTELHELDREAVALVCGKGGRTTTVAAIQSLRDWIPLINGLSDLDDRMRCVVGVLQHRELLAESVATEIVTILYPSVRPETRELMVYALTGLGPFPSLAGVDADVVAQLVPYLDVVEVIDGLFRGSDAASSERVVRAVVEGVNAVAATPPHGYRAALKDRCESLVLALSQCAGWEMLIAGRDERRNMARRFIERSGLAREEWMELLSAKPSEGRDDTA